MARSDPPGGRGRDGECRCATLTLAKAASTSAVSTSIAIAPIWYWFGGNSTQLFAFDVTLPTQPKFASQLTFGQTDGWDFGTPLAANDTVYLGYKVLPASTANANAQAAGSADPVNRYFLKLIDYSDSSAPVAADDGVNLPGNLRALGRQGTLLYTVGRQLKIADGSLDGTGCALQASSFDGAAAHLLDQIPLQSVAQPFLVSGANLLVLNPQPAQLWQLDASTGSYASTPNPASTTLDAWSLGDNGKFSQGATLTLNHELSLGQVQTLGVLRSNDRNIRLLDLSDFTNPLDLGGSTVELNGYSSLENADGNAQDGLWLPLGAYGVDVISIAHSTETTQLAQCTTAPGSTRPAAAWPLAGSVDRLRVQALPNGGAHNEIRRGRRIEHARARRVVRCEAARSSGVKDPGHPPPLGG